MRVCSSIAELRAVLRDPGRVGFVPTMGALHDGHLSLVRAAKAESDLVVVSIFVNPMQFGPTEDFSKYPRSFERDRDLLEKEQVDLLFAPSVREIYPDGASTFVTVDGLSERLCGRSRPGHFRGVTTVVAKLFNIVEPDLAFFGQKDAAQVAIIKRMVTDLNLAVRIVVCPIVREPDGLAMSSRNAYLKPEERRRALVLSRALQKVEHSFHQGEHHAPALIAIGKDVFAEEPLVRVDYFEIVNPDTLESVPEVEAPSLAAVAAFVGTTRLIDNIVLR